MKVNTSTDGSLVFTSSTGTISFSVSYDDAGYYRPTTANNTAGDLATYKATNVVGTGGFANLNLLMFVNVTTAGATNYWYYDQVNNIAVLLSSISGGSMAGTWTHSAPVWSLIPSVTSAANLTNVVANLSEATAISLLQFRLASKMQQFGEMLQQAGARAVEYTLKFLACTFLIVVFNVQFTMVLIVFLSCSVKFYKLHNPLLMTLLVI